MKILLSLLFVILNSAVASGNFATLAGWNVNKRYFVDPAGNDSNTGLSPSEAWKTCTKASTVVLQPGDQILLARGTVQGYALNLTNSGTFYRPVYVGCYGIGTLGLPQIDGSNTLTYCVAVNDKTNILIEYIEVKRGNADGFFFTGATKNIRVNRCIAHHCVTPSGNGFHPELTSQGLLEHSQSYSNEDNGFSQHSTGSSWKLIHFEAFANSNMGLYNINFSTNLTFNSTFWGNTNHGVEIDDGIMGLTDCLIYSNGVYGCMAAGTLGMTNCDIIYNKDGLLANNAGGFAYAVRCRFGSNWNACVEVGNSIVCLYSNIFFGTNQYAIATTDDRGIVTNVWSYTPDSAMFNNGANNSFYMGFCISDGDSASVNHYGYRINGVGTFGIIENCYVNSSGNYAIRNDLVPITVNNFAARNCTGGNVFSAAGTFTNCVGDDATFPLLGGNKRSRDFTTNYQSLVVGNANYAIPIVNAANDVYQKGIPVAGNVTTYFNGVTISGNPSVGAKGP